MKTVIGLIEASSQIELTEEERTKEEYRLGMQKTKMGKALVDAVKILERIAPVWLGPGR